MEPAGIEPDVSLDGERRRRFAAPADRMEPAGIEPATSWLQTKRSPN
jgi:hypothetical protein